MFKHFFQKKNQSNDAGNLPITNDHNVPPGQLPRRLSLWQLTLMGVGTTLGTGIFFALAETVPLAGPGVLLSFLVAAITAGLTALCYAEVSTALPVSGSSYTFTYVTMGEGMAVMIGACLILEWGIAAAAVAVGWSSYLYELIQLVTGFQIPSLWRLSPFQSDVAGLHWGGAGYLNVPAVVLVWLCVVILLRGSHDSAKLNACLTLTKLLVLLLFIAMSLQVFKRVHFYPFMPNGFEGVSSAAAIIFFSYVGLDAVVNASEEAINPQRNIPLAMIMALLVVTTIYVLVAFSSFGVQPAEAFVGRQAGLTAILQQATGNKFSSVALAFGAVASIFSVTLIALFGQARVYFAMARDGMMPAPLKRIDPKTFCPARATLLSAVVVTPLAAFLPSHVLWGLVSMGTLMAFLAVAVALMILRKQNKRSTANLPSKVFRVPGYPMTPLLSIASCIYLISNLSAVVYGLFSIWMALALLFYFFYARHGTVRAREH
jgi:APA family basic amino acid/polyamine antiporter